MSRKELKQDDEGKGCDVESEVDAELNSIYIDTDVVNTKDN